MADIEQVQTSDTLEQGRSKWNGNDSELETRIASAKASIDNLTATQNAVFYKKLSYSDGADIVGGVGRKFDLTSSVGAADLAVGSVQLSVNGIYYDSNDTQTTNSGSSFYIETKAVVWTNQEFSLDSNDELLVYFQKE